MTNLTTIMAQIEQDDKFKKDVTIENRRIAMQDDGRLRLSDRQHDGVLLNMSDYAMSQTFSKLGIPVAYGRILMDRRPDLLAPHFNYWINEEHKDYLLRMKLDDSTGTGLLRAFLSDRYTILDNRDAMGSFGAIVEQMEGVNIESFNLLDHRMHMRVTFDDLAVDLGKSQIEGKNDILKVGIDLGNSEVGASSLYVQSMVLRLICTNGMVGWRSGDDAFVQRHIHLTSRELFTRMNDAMGNIINAGDALLEAMANSKQFHVPNPMDVIKTLAKDAKYSKKVQEKLIEDFMVEPENTRYGVVNAFTRTARDMGRQGNLDMQIDMEKFAGELIKSGAKLIDRAIKTPSAEEYDSLLIPSPVQQAQEEKDTDIDFFKYLIK